jgi:hypothetical protein
MSLESFLMAQLSIMMVVLSVGIANVIAVGVIPNNNNTDDSNRTKTCENNDNSILKMKPWQII